MSAEPSELSLAIKEVVAAALDLKSSRMRYASAAARLRAQLGHSAHDHARRRAEASGAATEMPVSLRREIDGTPILVRGRADIVWDGDEGLTVEEVKTSSADDGTLSDRGREAARLQAALYALALHAEQPERPIELLVTVFGLVEREAPRQYRFPFDPEATEASLRRGLTRWLEGARQREAARHRRAAMAEHIRLPFATARPGQEEIIDAAKAALAQSRPVLIDAPTGTGKTAAALVPALRYALEHDASVWFLTAKTTQRRLVAQTFAAMMARAQASEPPLRTVVLRRKDAMCPPGHLRCHPKHCPLLARFEQEGEAALPKLLEQEGTVLSPEAVYAFGKEAQLCPYELMHAAAHEAELVVGDYHHGFDPRSVRTHGTGSMRRVVVVDEAHNLPDRARRASSRLVLQSSLRPLAEPSAPSLSLGEAARRLARLAERGMKETLPRATLEPRPALDGRVVVELGEGWATVGMRASLLALQWSHARFAQGDAAAGDPALDVMEQLAHLGELVERQDETLVGYVCTPEAEEGLGVGVDCVDPGPALERMHRSHVATIMASATLYPLDFYLAELGLASLDPVVAGTTSPFPREHRCVCIVPSVNTRARERDAFHPQVADVVAETMAARPGNYAVFVPSFRYAQGLQPHLESRLEGVQLLVQPPRAPERLRADFLSRLAAADRPTLLLAVAGGVFAEGVDLPGRALIGAIVVSPCLPGASFSRQLRQAWFDEHREGAGFAYAFAYPGMQRVIQAAGRVHRTIEDVGVLVLVGERFIEPIYVESVPETWWDHSVEELVTEDLTERLMRFWRDHPGDGSSGEIEEQ